MSVCECLNSEEATELLTSDQLPSSDSIVGAPYEFLGVSGSGGLATVYKARDRKLDRYVAVKVLQIGLEDSSAAQNFFREAKSASKLQHPNILTVQDFGKMQDGRQYLVTEWVEGITLAQYLQSHGPLTLETVQELFSQVLAGLSHAHNRGIVHRDIKPSNIMLARGECGGWTVKIIDFGLAREIDNDGATTRAEDMACSPFYMSPEQATGEKVDARTDLYSLGCSVFEVLTGRTPFIGKSLSVVMRHQLEEPPTLSTASGGIEFPPDLEKLIAKLLAKNPLDRYQSADELSASLRAVRKKKRQTEFQDGEVTDTPKKLQKTSRLWIVSICFVVLAILTLVAISFKIVGEPMIGESQHTTPTKKSQILDEVPDTFDGLIPKDYWQSSQSDVKIAISKNAKLDELPSGRVAILCLGLDRNRSLTGLRRLRALESLLVNNAPISESNISEIAWLYRLKILSFEGCKFSSNALEPLRKMASLKSLSIRNCEMSNASLAVLPSVNSLESIKIQSVTLTGPGNGIEPIGRMSKLRKLAIYGNMVNDSTVLKLRNMENLQSFTIDNAEITDEGCKDIARLKRLKTLEIFTTGNFISDKGVAEIATLPELRDLCIRGAQVTDNGLMNLAKNAQKLRTLNVVGCPNITKKGVEQFQTIRKSVLVNYGETVVGIDEVLDADPLVDEEFGTLLRTHKSTRK